MKTNLTISLSPVFFTLVMASLACSLIIPTAVPPAPSPTVEPTEETQEPDPSSIPPPTAFPGTAISFGRLSLVVPPGLATGISGVEVPRLEGSDIPPWEFTPGHTQLTLEGYMLQDKFHQAQVFLYPAESFARLNETASANIAILQMAASNPTQPLTPETLPRIPFFNAGQVFAANIRPITFQNGQGVRFITEYAQYFAYANNHDLFYQFQGLTAEGKYYVIAILPLTAPGLPDDSLAAPNTPGGGGTTLPEYEAPEADWVRYYDGISDYLDHLPEGDFSPALAHLDALIQSIEVVETP